MVYEYDVTKLCNLIETITIQYAVVNDSNIEPISDGLTSTKIQKLCYFCDFDHFEKYGESITDCIYVRTPRGPSPIYFHKALRELVTDERIYVDHDVINPIPALVDKARDSMYSREIPDTGVWDFDEFMTIVETVKKYLGYDEKTICRLSRMDNPSQIAGDYQALNYNAAYYRKPPFSCRRDDDE